ncbi:MAG: dockerin type I repeat-containing protein, partial [Planctomycetota bacterium]
AAFSAILTAWVLLPGVAAGQPVNDVCGQPVSILDLPFHSGHVNLDAATPDPIAGCWNAPDSWFYYLASTNGSIFVDGWGSPAPRFAIYEIPGGAPGDCPMPSQQIHCGAQTAIAVVAGHAYYFQVGKTSTPVATLSLSWFGDSCQTPEIIATLPHDTAVEHDYATNDGPPGCALSRTVWFYFEAPMDGQVRVDSGNPVSIYELPGGSLGVCPLATDRIFCAANHFFFSVVAGSAYLFQAGGTGSSQLELEWYVPEPNETCATPVSVAVPGGASGDFLNAEASVAGTPCAMNHDLWYEIVSPDPVSVRIEAIAGQTYAGRIAIYSATGSCPTPSDMLYCGPSPGYLTMPAGQPFLLQVGYQNLGPAPSNLGVSIQYGVPFGVVDDRYTLEIPSVVVTQGASFEVPVLLDVGPGAVGPVTLVDGWSYGVCVDATQIQVTSVAFGATTLTVNGGMMAGGYDISVFPDQGFSAHAIIDFFGVHKLGTGTDYELNIVQCEAVGTAGTTTHLEFCDTIGNPDVPIAVLSLGASVLPNQIHGLVSIVDLPLFRRGDCNLDTSINLADAVFLLGYLFPGPTAAAPGCQRACDANDDGALDIADAIAVLDSLFGQAGPLPAPECGTDDTPGTLTCAQPGACP